MSRNTIQLSDIRKSYRLGRVTVQALQQVDLDIAAGEFVALAGASGSGKTTLLNIIGCIDKPDRGRVVIDGRDVTQLPLHRLAPFRRESLGFVFQTFNLIPVLTAFENVEYPLMMRGVSPRDRRRRVTDWLERVGVGEQSQQRPDQMSGGQRQRVAIARAMAGEPKLVIADEPTANLDSATALRILDLLAAINESTGTTFVFSSHDPQLIERARRVVNLRDGRVQAELEMARAS